jgi:hypothetical protein
LRSWLGRYRLTVQQLSSSMGPSQHIGRARPSTGCNPAEYSSSRTSNAPRFVK